MFRSKVVRLFAALSAAAFLLAACGGNSGSGSDSGASDPPKAVSANTYASQVCTSIGGWLDDIKTQSTSISEKLSADSSPEQGKQVLVQFLTNITDRTDQLISDVQGIGPPDVTNGSELNSKLVEILDKGKQAFADAETKAEALPTGSKQEFQSAAGQISNSLSTAGQQIQGSVADTQSSPELKKAFQSADTCTSLGT